MPDWKRVKVDFNTVKLGDFIEPVKMNIAQSDSSVYGEVYGVTNTEGIVKTGKKASADISKYIIIDQNYFAYNPYRINVGSIGANFNGLKGCVSPAYVVFKTKEGLDPVFLWYYLKSDFGNHLINWYGNRGGVRNALRYNDLCKIDIPAISYEKQLEVISKVDHYNHEKSVLYEELEKQESYLKQLRQAILQEAVEGKLTVDLPCRQAGWRNLKFRNISGKIVPAKSDKYFAYVLECDDGSLYKGSTKNLYERINRHLEGRGAEWTQKHTPIALVHFEEFESEKEALDREKYFKSGSGREWLNKIWAERKDKNESASRLLEKIKAEKEQLLKEGKIKKQKTLPPISEEEIPFELPEGWVWCRLGDVADHSLGKMLDKGKNKGEYKKYLRNLNVRWFEFDLDDLLEMRIQKDEYKKYSIKKDDLVICEGGYPGRAAIWNNEETIFFQKALHRVRFYINGMNKYYIYFLFLSDLNGYLKDYFTGAGIQHFTGKSLHKFVYSLPPIVEQQAIVEKIDRLMAKIDALEEQVKSRKGQAEQLMQAVLREAFNGG